MPLIPEPDWEFIRAQWPRSAPRLVVDEVHEQGLPVHRHFSEPHVVFVGSLPRG